MKMTLRQAANYLKVSRIFLRRQNIPFTRINTRGDRIYNLRDLQAWIQDKASILL